MPSNVLRFLTVSLHGVLLLHVIFVPSTCVILKHDVIQVISHFLLSFSATLSSLFQVFLGMPFFIIHSCFCFRVHHLQFRLISSPINPKASFWHIRSKLIIRYFCGISGCGCSAGLQFFLFGRPLSFMDFVASVDDLVLALLLHYVCESGDIVSFACMSL